MGAADGIPTRTPLLEQLGPYLLLDHIGTGGMAEGYRAVRVGGAGVVHQQVFLKRIRAAFRSDPDFLRWFLRESAILATLRHPNVVSLVEADPEGRYLALELVDGIDMRHLLKHEGRLDVDTTVLITLELLKALMYAHSRTRGGQPAGIVHRDISPANILISYAGAVKLTDFGTAAVIRAYGEPETSVVGKEPYQSPEERERQHLDGRADLFSLGIVCYLALTGQHPFPRKGPARAEAIAAGTYVPLRKLAPDVPAGLAEIFERLLKPDPNERGEGALQCFLALANYAPSPALCIELGHMAQRAKPHETAEIDLALQLRDSTPDHAASSATLTPRARLNTADVPTARARLITHETVPMPAATAVPHDASRKLAPSVAVTHTPGGRGPSPRPPLEKAAAKTITPAPQRHHARRARTAALCILAALSAAAVVSPALSPRSQPATSHSANTATVAQGLKAYAGAPAPAITLADDDALRARSSSSTDPVAVSAPQTTQPSDPLPEPISAKKEAKHGTLIVGALPAGNVWVDGELIGWSPVRGLKLPAGEHEVEIGDASPTQKRPVTIVAGKKTTVVF